MRWVLKAYTRYYLKYAITIYGWRYIIIAITYRFIKDV